MEWMDGRTHCNILSEVSFNSSCNHLSFHPQVLGNTAQKYTGNRTETTWEIVLEHDVDSSHCCKNMDTYVFV